MDGISTGSHMINIHKTQSRSYFELQLNNIYMYLFEDHVKTQWGMSHLDNFTTSVKCLWNT